MAEKEIGVGLIKYKESELQGERPTLETKNHDSEDETKRD